MVGKTSIDTEYLKQDIVWRKSTWEIKINKRTEFFQNKGLFKILN